MSALQLKERPAVSVKEAPANTLSTLVRASEVTDSKPVVKAPVDAPVAPLVAVAPQPLDGPEPTYAEVAPVAVEGKPAEEGYHYVQPVEAQEVSGEEEHASKDELAEMFTEVDNEPRVEDFQDIYAALHLGHASMDKLILPEAYKQQMNEVVNFVTGKTKSTKRSKGLLLRGTTGSGKTALAEYVADQAKVAGVPVLSLDANDFLTGTINETSTALKKSVVDFLDTAKTTARLKNQDPEAVPAAVIRFEEAHNLFGVRKDDNEWRLRSGAITKIMDDYKYGDMRVLFVFTTRFTLASDVQERADWKLRTMDPDAALRGLALYKFVNEQVEKGPDGYTSETFAPDVVNIVAGLRTLNPDKRASLLSGLEAMGRTKVRRATPETQWAANLAEFISTTKDFSYRDLVSLVETSVNYAEEQGTPVDFAKLMQLVNLQKVVIEDRQEREAEEARLYGINQRVLVAA